MTDQNLGARVHTEKTDAQRYPRLASFLDRIIGWTVVGTVFAVPLIVLPWATDRLELHKQTILLVLAGIGLLAWMGKAMAERALTLTRSWLHLTVFGFIAGYAVVSWFSIDRFLSFAGHVGQYQWAFSTLLGFALLYFLVTQTVRKEGVWQRYLFAFLLSSGLIALLGILQLFGVPVFAWVGNAGRAHTFNAIGNVNALATFLTIPILVAASIAATARPHAKEDAMIPGGWIGLATIWAASLLSLAVIVLVDFWVAWTVLLFGAALILLLSIGHHRRAVSSLGLAVPGVVAAVSILFLFAETPVNLGIGGEISPSFRASWDIARGALQDRPLTGSGPGTWMHDYAKFRSVSVNLSPYWTIRFERGISAFLTYLATAGLIGTALWIILIISGIGKSAARLVTEASDPRWRQLAVAFVGWASVVFLAFLYNYNVAHQLEFWFFFALVASAVSQSWLTWDTRKSVVSSSFLSLKFLFLTAGIIAGVWVLGQRYVSEIRTFAALEAHRNGAPVNVVFDRLSGAFRLNPWNDVAARNMAQAGLIQIQNELASPADEGKGARVNTAVKNAVLFAQKATEIAPANVQNWANFGSVLRAIASFTPGADERAIAMYREALAREPNNPVYWNEIGELFILRADAYATLLQSSDAAVVEKARDDIRAQLDEALAALNQSVLAKPDFAPAHYNLALVYERQNRIPDAIVKLEQVLGTDSKDIGVAFQLGILYYRNGDKEKSRDLFEQLVAFDPNYSNARWYLSALYEEEGRLDEALEQVRKVEELNAGNPLVEERRKSLEARLAGAPFGEPELPTPVEENIVSP